MHHQKKDSFEEQNETIKVILIGCNILHKVYYIIFIPLKSRIFFVKHHFLVEMLKTIKSLLKYYSKSTTRLAEIRL